MTNKYFSILTGAVILACLQAGCANAPANAENPSAQPAAKNADSTPFPELKVGMTGDVIRSKLGDPIEIRPMESKVGKTEVWVFHIVRTVDTTQVATSTKDVPAFSLNTIDKLTSYPEMVYSMADKKAETILSLLMIDGRLIAQTAATREHMEYK